MLKNETYTGTRYYNRLTAAKDGNREGKQVVRGKWIYRDPAEWIAVQVPAIVSRELFDEVQERLRQYEERYCKPITRYLLSGLVQCGVCGSACSSSRRYHKVVQPSGKVSVYHRAIYRCNRQAQENMHDRARIERCTNSRIGTHILEDKVFEMIRDTMLHPSMLRGCIEGGSGLDDRKIARRLARVAENIGAVEDERRRLIDRYAAEEIGGEEYIAANRALDGDLGRLTRERASLVAAPAFGNSAQPRTPACCGAPTSMRSASSSWITLKGNIQPLQGYDTGLRARAIGVGRKQDSISHRGRDRHCGCTLQFATERPPKAAAGSKPAFGSGTVLRCGGVGSNLARADQSRGRAYSYPLERKLLSC
jgi:hypothetical protein